MFKHNTLSIKKYSLNSLDASDRSEKILINFAFVLLKVDNFHQLKIRIFNAINHQILFVQSSKFILNAKVRTIVSYFAHQSTITYDSHLFNQSCKFE